MKSKILTILLFSVLFLAINVSASEVTGTLSTGLSGNTGQVVNGVVISVPAANPIPGTYTIPQEVTLTAQGASSIRYTFDGTNPGCSPAAGISFSIPIPISVNRTIKAVSCYPGGYSSEMVTFAYIINPEQSPTSGGGGAGGGYYAPATKTGDINGDAKVDKYDFALMMSQWGKTGSNSADLNGDLKVDKYDFALLMANWGK